MDVEFLNFTFVIPSAINLSETSHEHKQQISTNQMKLSTYKTPLRITQNCLVKGQISLTDCWALAQCPPMHSLITQSK